MEVASPRIDDCRSDFDQRRETWRSYNELELDEIDVLTISLL